MKAFLSVFMICLLLLLPGMAMGEGTADAPAAVPATLTAIGTAEIVVQPDMAVLIFDITDTAAAVTDAQAATAATLETLNALLEAMGIAKEDIDTSYYSVNTVYSYQYGKLGEGESPSGYSVKSSVTITLHDVTLVMNVIDAALQSGADNSYELCFESSKAQAAYDEALALAAQDAGRKAALLAQAAQVSLGEMISLRECGDDAQPVLVLKNTGDTAAAEHSKTLTVYAGVEVTYGITK